LVGSKNRVSNFTDGAGVAYETFAAQFGAMCAVRYVGLPFFVWARYDLLCGLRHLGHSRKDLLIGKADRIQAIFFL
jgi:hypothetical protein